MRYRTASGVALAAFVVGLLAPAAYATSYPTAWNTIFGHSTSCALGRGSVNDTTHKSGASTVNRKGCKAGNAAVTVPPGYILAQTQLVKVTSSTWHYCSYNTGDWNSTVTATLTYTSALVPSAYCPAKNADYFGASAHWRHKAAGGNASITLGTDIVTFE